MRMLNLRQKLRSLDDKERTFLAHYINKKVRDRRRRPVQFAMRTSCFAWIILANLPTEPSTILISLFGGLLAAVILHLPVCYEEMPILRRRHPR